MSWKRLTTLSSFFPLRATGNISISALFPTRKSRQLCSDEPGLPNEPTLLYGLHEPTYGRPPCAHRAFLLHPQKRKRAHNHHGL